MEPPSLLPPLDAAVAAGDVEEGPKLDSGLRIRGFYSSSVREDGLRLSPSGTNLQSTSKKKSRLWRDFHSTNIFPSIFH